MGVGGSLHVTKRLPAWLILRFHCANGRPPSPFPRYSFLPQEERLGSGCYFTIGRRWRLSPRGVHACISPMRHADKWREAQRSGEGSIIGACRGKMPRACQGRLSLSAEQFSGECKLAFSFLCQRSIARTFSPKDHI